MNNVWLILNRTSRAVGDDWGAKLKAAFEARTTSVAGVTDFPSDQLPALAELDAAKVDVVAVAAGDGTINAVSRALESWSGALLVLPGGTMNRLAITLHGDGAAESIIAAVSSPAATRSVPTVDSGDERALVGVIAGPAASWVHAREAVRHGAWGKLRRAVRLAYLRTLSHSIHLRVGRLRSRGYRAVFVHPDGDMLSVVKVRASGWTDGVRLGWSYLTGGWENARGVETEQMTEVNIADDGQTFALFDGEPLHLPHDAKLVRGETRLRFVTTL